MLPCIYSQTIDVYLMEHFWSLVLLNPVLHREFFYDVESASSKQFTIAIYITFFSYIIKGKFIGVDLL